MAYMYNPTTRAIVYDSTLKMTWGEQMEQDRMSVRLVKHNGSFCYMAETLHHGPGKYEWAAGKTAEAAVCALATRLRVGNEEGYQKISSLLDRPFIRKRRSPPPTLSSFDPR